MQKYHCFVKEGQQLCLFSQGHLGVEADSFVGHYGV
jgi:hypothetical protein